MPFAERVIGLLTATLVATNPTAGLEPGAGKLPVDKVEVVAESSELVFEVDIVDPVSELEAPVVDGVTHSVGLPFRGRLIDGRKLEASELVRFKVGTPEHERYGTDEMVVLLEEAARHVARVLPGAALTMGDLSRQNGGRMGTHRSHRNGRDADVVFYALQPDGVPAQPDRLVAYRPDGTGRGAGDGAPFRFDEKRNWELIRFLLDNDIAEVQHIFISRYLRTRLLAEARWRGEPAELIERAARVMKHRGGRHHDHFHVRILCADDDRRCLDAGVRPSPRAH